MTIKSRSGSDGRKGYTKAKKRSERRKMRATYKGPITLGEILHGTTQADKEALDTRALSVRMIPTDPDSLTITKRYRVLSQPKRPIDVLRTKHFAESAIAGNNMTTGPQRYALWRSLLDGAALASFQRHSTAQGNETNDNLRLVVQEWLKDMFPPKILPNHQRYLRNEVEKPYHVPTKTFAGLVEELNNYSTELPPNFNDAQKIQEDELREHIVSALPKRQRDVLRANGIEPRTATLATIVETAERAEEIDSYYGMSESSDESSEDDKPRKNSRKKPKSTKNSSNRKPAPKGEKESKSFWCDLHKSNPTHNTENCWELKRQEKAKASKKSKQDYKKELHLLESKLAEQKKALKASNKARDREQKKFNEYMKRDKAKREAELVDSDSDSEVEAPKKMKRIPRKKLVERDDDSDSGDSSSS